MTPPPGGSRAKILASIALTVCSVVLAVGVGEVVLRVKNSSMTTYDIEMWRYAKELKVRSDDPHLDFDHVKSKSAVLQNVTIRLNEWGLRGGPVEPLPPAAGASCFSAARSRSAGACPRSATVEARLEQMLRDTGEQVQVLNAGVGNYNADRYVSRFFKELTGLNPTDIVVHYFLRDAEDLPAGRRQRPAPQQRAGGHAVDCLSPVVRQGRRESLVDHYRAAYQEDAPGFVEMQARLKELADYAKAHAHPPLPGDDARRAQPDRLQVRLRPRHDAPDRRGRRLHLSSTCCRRCAAGRRRICSPCPAIRIRTRSATS